MFFPSPWSFSLRFGKLLQSNGLHNPKSESFIWPYRSSSKLSGLMSLWRKAKSYSKGDQSKLLKLVCVYAHTYNKSKCKIHIHKTLEPNRSLTRLYIWSMWLLVKTKQTVWGLFWKKKKMQNAKLNIDILTG